MERVRCFWLEPTDRQTRALRRYSPGQGNCSGPMTYHNAEVRIEDGPAGEPTCALRAGHPLLADLRWPTQCACGYQFTPTDERQLFSQQLYRRTDTGEETTLRRAPPGAMWDAHWYGDRCGPDGKHLMVKLPDGHDWFVDGRANNCTMKDDSVHRCWVRHGAPPDVTVDKGGHTCAAGAGSIATPKYHGFLRNGYLERC